MRKLKEHLVRLLACFNIGPSEETLVHNCEAFLFSLANSNDELFSHIVLLNDLVAVA